MHHRRQSDPRDNTALALWACVVCAGVFAAIATGPGCDRQDDPATPAGSAGTTSRSRPSETGAHGWANVASMSIEDLRAEAFAICDQADSDFPNSADPLILRGNLHRQYGNRAEAIKWWDKALERNSTRVEVYYLMAIMAEDNGDFNNVVDLCVKARSLYPSLNGVNRKLGKALLELGKPAKAVEALHKALGQDPQDVGAHVGLGRAYMQLKQYEDAAASYTKAIELAPDDSRGHYGMAMVSRNLGRAEDAKLSLQKFTALRREEDKSIRVGRRVSDDLPWMRRTLSATHTAAAQLVYLRNRQATKAERHLLRACELDLKDQSCRQRLMGLYIAQKRFDAAIKALRKDIEMAPDEPMGHRSLTMVLLQGTRDFPAAMASAEKLVKLAPTGESYYILSMACEANKDLDGARKAITRAHELAGDNPIVKRAYERLGKQGGGKTLRERT